MTEEARNIVGKLRCAETELKEVGSTYFEDDDFGTAADLIESLLEQLEQVTNERDGLNIMLAQAQAMLETRTKERDAAVRDLERAEESADEVCRFLDNEVHPVCSYALYVDLHNAISEIVHWNNDEEWRGVEKEQ